VLCACSEAPIHRYAVDQLELPQTGSDAMTFGVDLDGDGMVDNQLGVIFSALVMTHDASGSSADMIASGAIASSVDVQDGRATYHGRDSDATIVLPVFADADPVVLPIDHVQISLVPDGTGYTGFVRGGVPIAAARTAAYAGVQQMMTDNSTAHLIFARALDVDHDGKITTDEIANSSLLGAFLVPDLQADQELSVGIRVQLLDGPIVAVPADPCHDRVQDGDEIAIDCGGSCMACPVANPTCSDGVRDQFESDVDCGAACPACTAGQMCAISADCASGTCSGPGVGSVGRCAP